MIPTTARPSAIMLPAENEMGPAMRALNPSQQAFVMAMCTSGGRNHGECARVAGYGNTDGSTRLSGHRLAHHPGVLAAIREVADKFAASYNLLAMERLREMAFDNDPTTKPTALKATVELLNRGGMIVQTQHKVVVEDSREREEIKKSMIELARMAGMDPKKLIGEDVVDAEFTVVDTALEDMLK